MESEFMITQTTWEKLHIFFLSCQSSEMPQNLRLESTHDSGAVRGLIVPRYKLYSISSVTSNTCSATLNVIIEGFSSCCPPEWCLIKIVFLDNTIYLIWNHLQYHNFFNRFHTLRLSWKSDEEQASSQQSIICNCKQYRVMYCTDVCVTYRLSLILG